jgi:CBS domain-containing protein
MVRAALDTLITYNPWTLGPATTLAEAARILDDTGIGQWPVVADDGALVGQVSACEVSAALVRDPSGQSTVMPLVRKDLLPIELGACPWEALQRMLDHHARMLPVVDGGRVVGTLSTADFLRELSCGGSRFGRELLLEFIERQCEVIDSDATLDHARAALAGAPCLVVVQGDFPLGAITPVLLAAAHVQCFARGKQRALGQLLQSAPTIVPGRTLGEAATLLLDHGLDALAVVSQSGRLSGVLTEGRILEGMLATT